MSYIITNDTELNNFKNFIKSNPEVPIVYVWCKNYYKVYYVGCTCQKGNKKIHYLNSHRILPKFKQIFENNEKLIIYLNYNEDSLITFFRPKLNKQKAGISLNRRNIRFPFKEYYLPEIDKDPYDIRPSYSILDKFKFFLEINNKIKNNELTIDENDIICKNYLVRSIICSLHFKYHTEVLTYIKNNYVDDFYRLRYDEFINSFEKLPTT